MSIKGRQNKNIKSLKLHLNLRRIHVGQNG